MGTWTDHSRMRCVGAMREKKRGILGIAVPGVLEPRLERGRPVAGRPGKGRSRSEESLARVLRILAPSRRGPHSDEAHLPAKEAQARPNARLSRANEHPCRA